MQTNPAPNFDQLIKDLASGDEAVILNAVKLLDEMGDLRAVEPLIQLLYASLEKEQYEVIFKVTRTLGNLGDIRALEVLFYALIVYQKYRWYKREGIFLGALYNLGEPAIQLAVRVVKIDDKVVRDASYYFIYQIAQNSSSPKEFVDVKSLLLVLLDAPYSGYRKRALEALAEFDTDEVRNSVIKELRNNNRYTRVIALNTLAKIGNAETLPEIIPFAEMDRDRYHINDDSIEAAKRAISIINQRLYLPRYISWRFSNHKDFDQLIEDLSSDDTDVVIRAVNLLGKDLRAVEPLIKLLYASLEKEQYKVVTYVSYTLGNLKDVRAVEPLFYGLTRYNIKPWYKGLDDFLHALRNIGEASALEIAIKGAESEDKFTRKAAHQIIFSALTAQLIAEKAIDITLPLILLNASESNIREKTIIILRRFDTQEVRKSLVKMLDDENEWIHQITLETLARVGDADTIIAIEQFMERERGKVQVNRNSLSVANEAIAAIKQRLKIL